MIPLSYLGFVPEFLEYYSPGHHPRLIISKVPEHVACRHVPMPELVNIWLSTIPIYGQQRMEEPTKSAICRWNAHVHDEASRNLKKTIDARWLRDFKLIGSCKFQNTFAPPVCGFGKAKTFPHDYQSKPFCAILQIHSGIMKDDPERLSTDFIKSICRTSKKCKEVSE